jgi:hypothetical protein
MFHCSKSQRGQTYGVILGLDCASLENHRLNVTSLLSSDCSSISTNSWRNTARVLSELTLLMWFYPSFRFFNLLRSDILHLIRKVYQFDFDSAPSGMHSAPSMTAFFYSIMPHNFHSITEFVLHVHDKLIPVPSEFFNNLFSGSLKIPSQFSSLYPNPAKGLFQPLFDFFGIRWFCLLSVSTQMSTNTQVFSHSFKPAVTPFDTRIP